MSTALSAFPGVVLVLAFSVEIGAQDHSAQQVLEKGAAEGFVKSKGLTTFIDGIPPITYQGKICDQTQATNNADDTRSVDVSCNFDQDGTQRQCNFRWNEGGVAKVSISTYKNRQISDNKSFSLQSNSDIIERKGVKWENVAQAAQSMVDSYCAAKLPNPSTVMHTKESIFIEGLHDCTYRTQLTKGHNENQDRELTCYTREVTAADKRICTYRDDDTGAVSWGIRGKPTLKTNIMDHEDLDGSRSTLKDVSSSQNKLKEYADDDEFRSNAAAWMKANCK